MAKGYEEGEVKMQVNRNWLLARWHGYRRELDRLVRGDGVVPDRGLVDVGDDEPIEDFEYVTGIRVGQVKRRVFWIGYLWGRLREMEEQFFGRSWADKGERGDGFGCVVSRAGEERGGGEGC